MSQVFFRCKVFPTGFAHEWLLSCVRSLMVGQHVLLSEPCITLITCKWLLSCVSPAVHLEGRVLGKSGPAVSTLKGFCACVCPLVQQQGSFGAECFPAVRTDVSQIAFMHLSLMADDILLSLKGLVAGFADEEPLITVNVLFMDFQIAAVCEGLRAGLTAINHICFHAMVRTDML